MDMWFEFLRKYGAFAYLVIVFVAKFIGAYILVSLTFEVARSSV